MSPIFNKKIAAIIIVLAVLGIGVFVFTGPRKTAPVIPPVETPKTAGPKHEIIGQSVEGRNIDAYTYGTGERQILFVGGMHGGYEWNSVLLAYQFVDYLNQNPKFIPDNLAISIIPDANPGGVYEVTGKNGRFAATDVTADKDTLASGRFNANKVDLNRNFDCKWKPKSAWQAKIVSAGSAPFSEPEAEAIRNFVLKNKPEAVIFWHSKSNAVYASECQNGILPETLHIMNAYSDASKYPAVKSFDSYEITGDAEGWLASIEIPAITVELKTHETVEWERNFAGVKALFDYYDLKKSAQ
jgi:hypothetical protein